MVFTSPIRFTMSERWRPSLSAGIKEMPTNKGKVTPGGQSHLHLGLSLFVIHWKNYKFIYRTQNENGTYRLLWHTICRSIVCHAIRSILNLSSSYITRPIWIYPVSKIGTLSHKDSPLFTDPLSILDLFSPSQTKSIQKPSMPYGMNLNRSIWNTNKVTYIKYEPPDWEFHYHLYFQN